MDDIEAIRRLKARYFRTMDTKDWVGMRQVFTDDVVIDTSEAGGNVVSGAVTAAASRWLVRATAAALSPAFRHLGVDAQGPLIGQIVGVAGALDVALGGEELGVQEPGVGGKSQLDRGPA